MNKIELSKILLRFTNGGSISSKSMYHFGKENVDKLVKDGIISFQIGEDLPYSLTDKGRQMRDEILLKLAGAKGKTLMANISRAGGDYSYLAANDNSIETCRKLKDLGLMSGGRAYGGFNRRVFNLTDEGNRLVAKFS